MIDIFADTSDLEEIEEMNANSLVAGFTTNPTLMKKAGVTDYQGFCKEVLKIVPDKPVSFEVFADDFDEMELQARVISSWGENVFVKIPITNTKRRSNLHLISLLVAEKIKLNVTAIMSDSQIAQLPVTSDTPMLASILGDTPMIVSIFAGRIADTGRDPLPYMRRAKTMVALYGACKILWASSREVLNIYQAEVAGADIITCTPDLIKKYEKFKNMDLGDLSLLTVKQFYDDAQSCGFVL